LYSYGKDFRFEWFFLPVLIYFLISRMKKDKELFLQIITKRKQSIYLSTVFKVTRLLQTPLNQHLRNRVQRCLYLQPCMQLYLHLMKSKNQKKNQLGYIMNHSTMFNCFKSDLCKIFGILVWLWKIIMKKKNCIFSNWLITSPSFPHVGDEW